MTVEIGKRYETVRGEPVEILKVDLLADYGIRVVVYFPQMHQSGLYTLDGVSYSGYHSLREVVEKTTATLFINVYRDSRGESVSYGSPQTSLEASKLAAGAGKVVARLKLHATFREGDGL